MIAYGFVTCEMNEINYRYSGVDYFLQGLNSVDRRVTRISKGLRLTIRRAYVSAYTRTMFNRTYALRSSLAILGYHVSVPI